MNLKGKNVVITGAGSGIGRATAEACAQAGAAVVLADIDAAAGQQAAEKIAAGGAQAHFVTVDVTDAGSVDAFARTAAEVLGRIDVLVNVVGWSTLKPFLESTPDVWAKLIDVNYTGVLHISKAVVPHIIAAGGGKVVNVASDAGRVGSIGESIYAGTKGAVMAFTKSLAREMARYAINVNCVCPGPTDTPLLASTPERHRESLARATPFRRFAKPSEVADAILFFASPRSDFVTGQILSVSGGLTMAG